MIKDGVKIDSAGYTQFLENNLKPWMKKKSATFKKKMVFMHDTHPLMLLNSPENG